MNAISEHHSCLLSLPNEPKGTYRHTEQRGSSISSPLLRYRLSRDDNNLFTFTVVNSPLGGWGGNRERRKKKKSKGKKKKKEQKETKREQQKCLCTPTLQKGCTHRLHTELQWWISSSALPERSTAVRIPWAERGPEPFPSTEGHLNCHETYVFCTDYSKRRERVFFFIKDDILLQSTEYSIFCFNRYNIQKDLRKDENLVSCLARKRTSAAWQKGTGVL